MIIARSAYQQQRFYILRMQTWFRMLRARFSVMPLLAAQRQQHSLEIALAAALTKSAQETKKCIQLEEQLENERAMRTSQTILNVDLKKQLSQLYEQLALLQQQNNDTSLAALHNSESKTTTVAAAVLATHVVEAYTTATAAVPCTFNGIARNGECSNDGQRCIACTATQSLSAVLCDNCVAQSVKAIAASQREEALQAELWQAVDNLNPLAWMRDSNNDEISHTDDDDATTRAEFGEEILLLFFLILFYITSLMSSSDN